MNILDISSGRCLCTYDSRKMEIFRYSYNGQAGKGVLRYFQSTEATGRLVSSQDGCKVSHIVYWSQVYFNMLLVLLGMKNFRIQ